MAFYLPVDWHNTESIFKNKKERYYKCNFFGKQNYQPHLKSSPEITWLDQEQVLVGRFPKKFTCQSMAYLPPNYVAEATGSTFHSHAPQRLIR